MNLQVKKKFNTDLGQNFLFFAYWAIGRIIKQTADLFRVMHDYR